MMLAYIIYCWKTCTNLSPQQIVEYQNDILPSLTNKSNLHNRQTLLCSSSSVWTGPVMHPRSRDNSQQQSSSIK